jgi:hypothetical protein
VGHARRRDCLDELDTEMSTYPREESLAAAEHHRRYCER